MNSETVEIEQRPFKDIVEGENPSYIQAAPPSMDLSQLVGSVDDTNELKVNEQVLAQNIANQQAGLPPISTDLVHPAVVDEDNLSPLYPKMSDLKVAAENGEPIPVDENAVKTLETEGNSIEKDNRNGYATNLVAMRRLMDAIDEANANTEEYEGTVDYSNLSADTRYMRNIINSMKDAEDKAVEPDATSVTVSDSGKITGVMNGAVTTNNGVILTLQEKVASLHRWAIGQAIVTVAMIAVYLAS